MASSIRSTRGPRFSSITSFVERRYLSFEEDLDAQKRVKRGAESGDPLVLPKRSVESKEIVRALFVFFAEHRQVGGIRRTQVSVFLSHILGRARYQSVAQGKGHPY